MWVQTERRSNLQKQRDRCPPMCCCLCLKWLAAPAALSTTQRCTATGCVPRCVGWVRGLRPQPHQPCQMPTVLRAHVTRTRACLAAL
jgi:hypothetical protein